MRRPEKCRVLFSSRWGCHKTSIPQKDESTHHRTNLVGSRYDRRLIGRISMNLHPQVIEDVGRSEVHADRSVFIRTPLAMASNLIQRRDGPKEPRSFP